MLIYAVVDNVQHHRVYVHNCFILTLAPEPIHVFHPFHLTVSRMYSPIRRVVQLRIEMAATSDSSDLAMADREPKRSIRIDQPYLCNAPGSGP